MYLSDYWWRNKVITSLYKYFSTFFVILVLCKKEGNFIFASLENVGMTVIRALSSSACPQVDVWVLLWWLKMQHASESRIINSFMKNWNKICKVYVCYNIYWLLLQVYQRASQCKTLLYFTWIQKFRKMQCCLILEKQAMFIKHILHIYNIWKNMLCEQVILCEDNKITDVCPWHH